MLKAVIFDLDGVVIDSNPFHRLAWEKFLVKRGIPVNEDIFNRVISGTPGDQALRILLGGEITDGQVQMFVNEIDAEYRESIRNSRAFAPMAGLREFLEELKKSGIMIALATSAPVENIDLVLSGLELSEFFGVIIGKSQVKNGKPHPEVYLTAMDMLGVQADQCVVFEDSLAGVQAAVNAQIKTLGVLTSETADTLLMAGASTTLSDFAGITLEDLSELLECRKL
ncbi:MAG TPA: HAD family phosphatase [Bacteroidales bacterium]|nr:HAD family phosphatase [Bacteroidales bacterium]